MTPQQKVRYESLVKEAIRVGCEVWDRQIYRTDGTVDWSLSLFDSKGDCFLSASIYESFKDEDNDRYLDKIESELYAYQECLAGQQRDKEIALMGEEL